MIYKSPNKKHGFDFHFEGEIRFGPEYYRISLNQKLLRNRIFGFEFKWHLNSNYLALQEWLYADERKGPHTALTIINLESQEIAIVSEAKGGFVKPIKFEESKVIFKKEDLSKGKIVEYEICLDEIHNWKKL